jgi:signal transduction histidine kinase
VRLSTRIVSTFIAAVSVSVFLFLLAACLAWGIASWGRYGDDDLFEAAEGLARAASRTAADPLEAPASGALVAGASRRFPGMSFELVSLDLSIKASSRGLTGRADLSGVIQFPHHVKQEWVQAQDVVSGGRLVGYALASVAEAQRKTIDIHFAAPGVILVAGLAIGGFLISLTVAGFAAGMLNRSTAGRFKRLHDAFGRLDLDHMGERIDDGDDDELGDLGRSFNRTAEALAAQTRERQAAHDKLKLVLTGVAHDLRTPLAIISGHAEHVATGVLRDEPERQAALERIQSLAGYMTRLLEGMVDFAAIEAGLPHGETSVFDLAEACRVALIDLLPRIEAAGLAIEPLIPDDPVLVLGNAQGFRRAFANVVDNAINHGGSGGKIDIALAIAEGQADITVRDYGPGIPADERERIFEPFHRVDRSRNSRIGGLGIGLHIARTSLRQASGDLRLADGPAGCTTFVLSLRIAPAHP